MFKINYIKFFNHQVFGNLEFNLSKNTNKSNYLSIIIGSNGTGKSILLQELCEIFMSLSSSFETSKINMQGINNFELSYVLNGKDYLIRNIYDVDLKNNIYPETILAVSYNLNDKYPIVTSRNKLFTSRYKYLGLRSTTNNAFISKYRKNFIENIYNIFQISGKIQILNDLFDNIQLPKDYNLILKAGKNYNAIFSDKKLTIEDFQKLIKGIINRKTRNINKRFSDVRFEHLSINEKLQKEIIDFYNNNLLGKNLQLQKENLIYKFSIDYSSLSNSFLKDFKQIQELISLEVLEIKELEILKGNSYAYNSSSSGEFHLINSITSIIAHITDNTLILIDEPEVSLHPNWQLKYIDLLNFILDKYKGCHTIIATHSHFLISNLKKENSTVLSTKRDFSDNIKIKEISEDTFGWSAENILYNVFSMATTRNHYFEMELRKVIKYIAERDNSKINEIKDFINKFRNNNLHSDDPLLKVISQAESFIQRVNND
ncbi:ATP-binding protein [Aliarcobacter butzleri]|uniref:ATP-binding protein n=1 Tax=Aliarcobacter butzleri TaxID=28197 RepID=UPI0021B22CE4|nr:ATP-binding protein [Aliarcobacter butzleri]UWY60121.1 ATP-binding protein [Aliarcobacter butzleri]